MSFSSPHHSPILAEAGNPLHVVGDSPLADYLRWRMPIGRRPADPDYGNDSAYVNWWEARDDVSAMPMTSDHMSVASISNLTGLNSPQRPITMLSPQRILFPELSPRKRPFKGMSSRRRRWRPMHNAFGKGLNCEELTRRAFHYRMEAYWFDDLPAMVKSFFYSELAAVQYRLNQLRLEKWQMMERVIEPPYGDPGVIEGDVNEMTNLLNDLAHYKLRNLNNCYRKDLYANLDQDERHVDRQIHDVFNNLLPSQYPSTPPPPLPPTPPRRPSRIPRYVGRRVQPTITSRPRPSTSSAAYRHTTGRAPLLPPTRRSASSARPRHGLRGQAAPFNPSANRRYSRAAPGPSRVAQPFPPMSTRTFLDQSRRQPEAPFPARVSASYHPFPPPYVSTVTRPQGSMLPIYGEPRRFPRQRPRAAQTVVPLKLKFARLLTWLKWQKEKERRQWLNETTFEDDSESFYEQDSLSSFFDSLG